MVINHLSEIMGRKRLKIADVVAGTGLAINTVSGLYHDKVKRVDLETLDKLCDFLEVGIGEILEHVKEGS
ncbi:helix-turn-helix transcriptional regulator [Paenibacillus sp. 3LSP]|uniref:helix-turn-helix domain-containing protein n=1 Tax=Paenibacillus sp. 3LSP TaxID=2800795 RepID=UPI0028FD3E79|nr:helix-turn-helix transcriptional regulator [Paenibacillus sp. 3LSP]MDU0332646.1 helix-turn-helix transcriptional regulator [Paenibacillus sp. 3LSP]